MLRVVTAPRLARRAGLAILALAATAVVAGCGSSGATGASSAAAGDAKFTVVAGENFWGSIAGQLAGNRATVTSIIVNPGTDPHDYQATAADSRTIAEGQMAIVNGIGYDTWMSKAVAANPVGGRVTLDVGSTLGLKEGDNPHQWYAPSSVLRVVDAIVADYKKLDPADGAYFDKRRRAFLTRGLARYNALRKQIRARYSGVPVGYSESIFQPLGADLGLKLLTPPGFADAVAEGTDISARDKQTVDRQAQTKQIKVWVYNRQNATPDVKRINQIAQAAGIPIATVTETLSPASDTFEQWQAAQLTQLEAALHKATGK
jgi:zinc/manganese transport system substrate-binding protein